MREKILEYHKEGGQWPLAANILDPVRHGKADFSPVLPHPLATHHPFHSTHPLAPSPLHLLWLARSCSLRLSLYLSHSPFTYSPLTRSLRVPPGPESHSSLQFSRAVPLIPLLLHSIHSSTYICLHTILPFTYGFLCSSLSFYLGTAVMKVCCRELCVCLSATHP